jgi:hypothetical protein
MFRKLDSFSVFKCKVEGKRTESVSVGFSWLSSDLDLPFYNLDDGQSPEEQFYIW